MNYLLPSKPANNNNNNHSPVAAPDPVPCLYPGLRSVLDSSLRVEQLALDFPAAPAAAAAAAAWLHCIGSQHGGSTAALIHRRRTRRN